MLKIPATSPENKVKGVKALIYACTLEQLNSWIFLG